MLNQVLIEEGRVAVSLNRLVHVVYEPQTGENMRPFALCTRLRRVIDDVLVFDTSVGDYRLNEARIFVETVSERLRGLPDDASERNLLEEALAAGGQDINKFERRAAGQL